MIHTMRVDPVIRLNEFRERVLKGSLAYGVL